VTVQMGLEIVITDSKNTDFIKLIKMLDDDLTERYGALQKQYEKHNKVDNINDVVIIYKYKVPVACGAFKEYDIDSVELKRIFVIKEQRQQGLAKLIVSKLEELARSKAYKFALLETGIKQHEAINLYKNNGYELIQNYEPYVGNTNSVCMKKVL
jgi:GNAT superfamily N-acetyltransferase